MALRIVEGIKGTVNMLTGDRTEDGPVFLVEKPYFLGKQDIGERVAEFDTRVEAEAYIAARETK